MLLLLVLLVVVAGGLYSTYQATQQAPEFYTTVVARPASPASAPPVKVAAEEQIHRVETAAKEKSLWRFEFTQDQINEYLAKDLFEQFPHLLPPQLKDPRIKLENGKALLGCQYDSERFKAVLWVETEAVVSEDGKAVKLIPKSAGAGVLPLPLTRLFEHIKKLEGASGDFSIQLTETAPQAIILRLGKDALPADEANYHIDAIKLEEEKFSMEGSWEK